MTSTQYTNDLRTVGHVIFWLLLLLAAIVGSQSVFGLEAQISAPATVSEGQLLTVDFSSDDPAATYELTRNGAYVTNAAPYEWQTTPNDAGPYTFTVTAYGDGGPATASVDVEVLNVPLAFTIEEPSASEYATTTIPVRVTPNEAADLCYTIVDGNTNTLTPDGDSYVGEIIKTDGIYTLTIKCKYGAEITEQSKTVLIDTQPPEIISFSPAIGVSLTAAPILSVTTDEIANCLMWNANDGEESATSMTSTDHLTHTRLVAPQQGTNNHYVRCTDVYGNVAQPHQMSYSFEAPPTASVEIVNYETDEILTAGTYDVELTVSETVQGKPSLTYTYQQGGSGTVALEKVTDTKWKGYLVVDADAGEKAGSFLFSAKDLNGITGTEITSGTLFLVDTVAPGQVQSLKAESSPLSIRLEWYWADEDMKFNIYRAKDKNVDLSDEYATVSDTQFTDVAVMDSIEYYYAVAAVDDAGNLGPLSTVVLGGAIPKQIEEQTAEKNAAQAYEAEQLSQRIDQVIFDIDAAYEELEKEKNEEKLLIIREFGYLERLAEMKVNLKASQRELATISEQGLMEGSFQDRLYAIHEETTKAFNTIPKRIQVEGSITFEQPTDINVQNRLIGRYLAEVDDQSAREAYKKETQSFMEETLIDGKVITATITFADRTEKKLTYISKEITLPSHHAPVSLVEYIPKEIAQDVSELTFKPEATVVEKDPVVEYTTPTGSNVFSYSYRLEKGIDLATARSVRTVAFPEREETVDTTNVVTGNVITVVPGLDFVKQYWLYLLGAAVILGLVIYYFAIDTESIPVAGAYSGQGIDQFVAALTSKLQAAVLTPQPIERQPIHPITRGQSNHFRSLRRPTPAFGVPSSGSQGSSVGSSLSQQKTEESFPIEQLLTMGHAAIDSKEYLKARGAYVNVLKQMDGLMQIDVKDRAAANLLYYKLLLYKKMQSALEAEQKGEYEALKQLLSELQDVATKLPESNSVLIEDAKEQFRTLQRGANRLAIEREKI